MNEGQAEFVQRHPEYFEQHGTYLTLRRDLRPLVEQYACAVDAEEFARLRNLVAGIRERERASLRSEIDRLQGEREKVAERLQLAQAQLDRFDREIQNTRWEMAQKTAPVIPQNTTSHWYYSPGFCFTLDSLGLVFLYAGLVMNSTISPSTTVLGVAFIGVGFALDGRRSSLRKRSSLVSPTPIASARREEFEKITRIKRTTLVQQIKNEKKLHRLLENQIQSHEKAIDQLTY